MAELCSPTKKDSNLEPFCLSLFLYFSLSLSPSLSLTPSPTKSCRPSLMLFVLPLSELWGVPRAQDAFLLPAASRQLSVFPSIPVHPTSTVQTGSGLHHLGLQTHHEECGRHRWAERTNKHTSLCESKRLWFYKLWCSEIQFLIAKHLWPVFVFLLSMFLTVIALSHIHKWKLWLCLCVSRASGPVHDAAEHRTGRGSSSELLSDLLLRHPAAHFLRCHGYVSYCRSVARQRESDMFFSVTNGAVILNKTASHQSHSESHKHCWSGHFPPEM